MGNNAGIATVKVEILDKSPFGSQSRQEQVHYMTKEVFDGLPLKSNSEALPAPISGFRCAEQVIGYNNFLQDMSATRLEDAFFNQQTIVTNSDGTQSTKTVSVSTDSAAVAREVEAQTGQTSDVEKAYFTWQTDDSLFTDAAFPRIFSLPPLLDNAPEWTYVLQHRPGAGNKAYLLMPFQRKNPPDTKSPVHWGCTKVNAISANQGFEMTYYYCMRDPSIAPDTSKLKPKYNFRAPSGQDKNGNLTFTPLDQLDLTKSVYFAFEFGVGSDNNHFLVILANDFLPMIFKITGKDATLIDIFQAANGKTIFDFNHKYLTISVESVQGALIIRSNAFFDTPWIVMPLTQEEPLFIDQGQLRAYGGNLQAGFAFRPLQFAKQGVLSFPDMSFNIFSNGSTTTLPTASVALKGGGEIQQNRTYNNSNGDPSGKGEPEVLMVESEKITTTGIGGKVDTKNAKTQVEYFSNIDIHRGLKRNVAIKLEETERPDSGSSTTNQFNQTLTSSQGKIDTRLFRLTITMESSDVPQPEGFVVKNGRSPYVWMVRVEIPNTEAEEPKPALDISCDVMSIDMTANAVSEHEINNTGSITVLNKRANGGRDYKSYTNRTIYFRISGGWGNCATAGTEVQPLFEGLSVSAEVTKKAEREVVVFKIEDYMSVLQSMKFILCPFYDGMKASLAVRDMVQMTGLADARILADSKPIKDANLSQDLGLPYIRPFESPQFRFPDGTALKEGILKIAKYDGKVIYFDQFGKFHLDTKPGGAFGDESWNVQANYFTKGAPDPFQLVWNQVTLSRHTKDCYNSISLVTVDKRVPTVIIALNDTYTNGIRNPSAEGYLGFKKPLIIKDAALGSFDAAASYFDVLRRRVIIPPLTARFEAYGRGGIRPLSVVTLDGQPLKVVNISSRFNAAENMFWQSIEGEWLFIAGKDESGGTQPASSESPATGGGAATTA